MIVINVEDVPLVERPNIRGRHASVASSARRRTRNARQFLAPTFLDADVLFTATPAQLRPNSLSAFGRFRFLSRWRNETRFGRLFPRGDLLRPAGMRCRQRNAGPAIRRREPQRLPLRRRTRARQRRTSQTRYVCQGRVHAAKTRWRQNQQRRLRGRLGTCQRPPAQVSRRTVPASRLHGPGSFDWLPVTVSPAHGQASRRISELRTRLSLYKVAPGARFALPTIRSTSLRQGPA